MVDWTSQWPRSGLDGGPRAAMFSRLGSGTGKRQLPVTIAALFGGGQRSRRGRWEVGGSVWSAAAARRVLGGDGNGTIPPSPKAKGPNFSVLAPWSEDPASVNCGSPSWLHSLSSINFVHAPLAAP